MRRLINSLYFSLFFIVILTPKFMDQDKLREYQERHAESDSEDLNDELRDAIENTEDASDYIPLPQEVVDRNAKPLE